MSIESQFDVTCRGATDELPSWFIYYQVHHNTLAGALAAARSLQRGLQARYPVLQATLMRRPGSRAGQVTLMEIYRFSTDASAAPGQVPLQISVIESAAAQALAGWLAGPRHVEVFEPCA
jgi:hypothetical protein